MVLVFSLMLSHTQNCKTFLQPMLDVLEHGGEGREQDMYCGDGKRGEKAQLSSSSCANTVRSRFRSSVWPSSQGQGSAQTRLGDHREHFSLLGKGCCLAAKMT